MEDLHQAAEDEGLRDIGNILGQGRVEVFALTAAQAREH